MSRSLIVLADDSVRPIVKAIAAARRSLRLKMFVFTDPSLLNAVIAASRRGVTVQVLLNPARRSGEQDNEHTRKVLERRRVDVRDASPAFVLTHEKSMVIDEESAFVMSLNWTTRNLVETRDYAVVTTRRRDVREIVDGFDADWHRQAFTPAQDSDLVWCPGPGRDRICQFIDDARRRLYVQNERLQDAVILERLVRAARRGVKVRVMVRAPHTLKRAKLIEGVGGLRILHDVGVKIRKLKHLKLHGKALLADGKAAMIGSINLATGSLDGRRELAIEVRDDSVTHRLRKIAEYDWRHARVLDLSDEGLLNDLDERVEGGAHLLALDGHEDDE